MAKAKPKLSTTLADMSYIWTLQNLIKRGESGLACADQVGEALQHIIDDLDTLLEAVNNG